MSFKSDLENAKEEALLELSHPNFEITTAVLELGEALDEVCYPVAKLIEEDSYTLYDLEHCLDEVYKLRELCQESLYGVKVTYSRIRETLQNLIKAKRNMSGDDY